MSSAFNFSCVSFCALVRPVIHYFLLSSQRLVVLLRNSLYLMDKSTRNRGNGNAYGHTIKYLSIFGGAHGLSVILNVVRTKISCILLGVAGQSIIALSNRTVQMFSDGTGLSLSLSAVRKIADTYENCDDGSLLKCVKVVRSLAFLTGIFGMLLMLAVVPLVSDWIFEASSEYYRSRIMMLSPVVLFMAVSNGEIAILRGTRRLNAIASYTLATAIISLIVAVPAYYAMGIGGIFPAIFITALLQMCVLLGFSLPQYRYVITPFSLSLLREGLEMVKLGAGYVFASIFTSFSMWLVCAALSDIGNGESAGLFTAGFVMTTLLPGMLFSALDSEYYPRLSGVAADAERCNRVVNEQIEVQLLVQSPLLMAFVVAMPALVPLFYNAEFVPAIAMAQFAMLGMFMRTMCFPLSFLALSKSDTKVYVSLEAVYNILFVFFIIAGYVLDGMTGVGIGIALLHTVDFIMVYSVARYRYGVKLSGNVICSFFVQLPLFVAVVAVARLCCIDWVYWIAGAICVLLSVSVTMYMFSRMEVLPKFLLRIMNKFFGRFKKRV